MTFVGLSIIIFVLESHKLFQVDDNTGLPMYTVEPIDPPASTGSPVDCCCHNKLIASNITSGPFDPVTHPALQALDYVCVCFFTLEIVIRFTFAPYKKKFWKTPLNVLDLVCLLPHFTSLILKATNLNKAAALLKTVMMLRVIRILRIFKLMKHYSAFKILVYTIKVSTKELLLMVVFLMSGVLMFASIIHYAEKENFPNIPIGIWWALVTMTTVGYGDKYPVGYIGYGVGCVSVVCGVLVIAFTVPIVVNNFSLYYSHAQTRIKLPNRRRKKEQDFPSRSTTSHSDSNIRPLVTPRGHKQLNVTTLENDLGRHEVRINHAQNRRQRGTPIDNTQIEDLESLDSGIVEEKRNKKVQFSIIISALPCPALHCPPKKNLTHSKKNALSCLALETKMANIDSTVFSQ